MRHAVIVDTLEQRNELIGSVAPGVAVFTINEQGRGENWEKITVLANTRWVEEWFVDNWCHRIKQHGTIKLLST